MATPEKKVAPGTPKVRETEDFIEKTYANGTVERTMKAKPKVTKPEAK